MRARTAAALLFTALLLTLSGCLKYNDQIEVDANGKGTAHFVVSRPVLGTWDKLKANAQDKAFQREELEKNLPAGVKLAEYTRKEENDRVEYSATYAFDDINALIGWAAQRPNNPFRDISVKRTGSTLEFTRSIKPSAEMAETARKFMPDTVFTFRLKGPGRIEQHNGTRLDNGAVVWEVKVADALAHGKDMKAAFFFGTPAWVYLLIAFLVIDAIVVAVVLKRRGKPAVAASHESTPAA